MSMEKMSVDLLLELKSHPRSVVSISPGESVATAARVLKERNVGLLVVLEGGNLVGVISERDIVHRWAFSDSPNPKAIVNDIMSKNVESVTTTDTVFDCYLRFVARNCRHLPVLDPMGTVIGVLSLRDVAKYVVGELTKLKAAQNHD